MKLVLAIISNDDSPSAIQALTCAGFFVTRISSSGGFLDIGNTTLLIGSSEEKIPVISSILKENCISKTQINPSLADFGKGLGCKDDSGVSKGGIMFVLNVENFEKI